MREKNFERNLNLSANKNLKNSKISGLYAELKISAHEFKRSEYVFKKMVQRRINFLMRTST